MSESTKASYRGKLKDIRAMVKACMNLAMSENEEIRVRAIGLFIDLSEMEIALTEALREDSRHEAQEVNPLARRVRAR